MCLASVFFVYLIYCMLIMNSHPFKSWCCNWMQHAFRLHLQTWEHFEKINQKNLQRRKTGEKIVINAGKWKMRNRYVECICATVQCSVFKRFHIHIFFMNWMNETSNFYFRFHHSFSIFFCKHRQNVICSIMRARM